VVVDGERAPLSWRLPISEPGRRLAHSASGSVGSDAPASGLIERPGLVERLLAAPEPVIALTAPPGYGKSTLLAAWAARRGSDVAWVSCDEVDDDPGSLWSAVSAALGSRVPLAELPPVTGPGAGDRIDGRPTRKVGGRADHVAVVLDQLEALTSRECRRSVAAFAQTVPPGWTLALASRAAMPLPAARMRVEQRLLEVGPGDLAMSEDEAAELFAAAGLQLPEAQTADLVTLTEGWPAALHLAALAIRDGEVTEARPFSGRHRLMSDYLRSELLDGVSRGQRRLLVRTSVLDRMSGTVGDAVLGTRTATRRLEQLHHRGVLQSVLGEDGWYRCHPLLRQLLLDELGRGRRDLVPELHLRAATWFEAHGAPELAIEHAYLAGEGEAFGRLVLEAMQPVWASGQIDTVLHWMEHLGRQTPAAHTPGMIAHGALIFALLGRPGDAERWAAVAESLPADGVLPDGSTVEGTLAYLRANLAAHGSVAMRRDTAAALEGLSPTSPYRATMVHTEGLADLLDGDLEGADAAFAHAYDLAASLETSPLTSLILAEQAQVASQRGDWAATESLVERALAMARGPLDGYWTSALVFATAAHTAAHRGDLAEARAQALRASKLRPLLTYALPVVSVQALVELARAYLLLVEPSGARAVMEQARGILRQRPRLGTLADAVHRLDERVNQITEATPVGHSSLTAAELRMLPLLPTHLTYPEIGQRLFISRHTVKTHAASVYRKLGVSSRAEAVERIHALGLI
jgi:LuxR family maltose regulon positive regulatory protein